MQFKEKNADRDNFADYKVLGVKQKKTKQYHSVVR